MLIFTLSACGIYGRKETPVLERNIPHETLSDLAYDAGGDGRVYLRESGVYVPHLVLSRDYGGNCLLLREYLLDETRIYNGSGEKASYYGESDIDRFLNEEFIQVYSDGLRANIVESDVEIAAKESIGSAMEETIVIQRMIFLLSYTELRGVPSRTILEEGSPLLYFKDKTNRIAHFANGEPSGWWLRSASTFGIISACRVNKEGVMGSAGIYNPNPGGGYFCGVRPALCLPRNMVLSRIEDGYAVGADN